MILIFLNIIQETMNLKIKSKTIIDIFEYILVFLIIAGNYSMIERDYALGISEYTLTFSACAISVCLFFYTIVVRNVNIREKKLHILFWAMLFSFGMIVTPGSDIVDGIIKWMMPIFFFGLYMAITLNERDVWIKFVNVIYVLAIISLILYIFGSVFHLIQPTSLSCYYYDHADRFCNNYYHLLYEAQKIQTTNWLTNTVYRNCGIFIEAPMYNILLCMAFGAEASFASIPRKRVLIILAITIISTFTTTGILFLGIMFVLFFLRSDSGYRIKILKMFIFPIIAAGVLFVVLTVLETKIQSNTGSVSYSVRTDHLIACLKMFLDRPLFGHGFGNSDAFYGYTKYVQGLSVGLPALLGRNGIFVFLVYIVPFMRCLKKNITHNRKEIAFFIGTFFLFFMTASVYKTVFLFLIATQLMWNNTYGTRNNSSSK